MDHLGTLRASLESGSHLACVSCPWSPAHGRAAFGWSCSTHGYHLDRPAPLLSLQLVQDPAGTTPDQTGKLCFVCNSANPSDRTAQASWELWRTAVLGVPHGGAPASRDEVDPLLERHFWMNSTMHGVAGDSPRAKQRPDALARCSMVLREVLERLAPRVLIVNGRQAEKAFQLTGLALDTSGFPHAWTDQGAARVRGRSGPNGSTPLEAFVTPHTSLKGVNFAAAPRFRPKETDAIVRRKAAEYGVADAAGAFLARYKNDDHATDRGMRVLLSHWLDIGAAIRAAAAETGVGSETRTAAPVGTALDLGRLVAARKAGSEPLRRGATPLGFTLLDFWRWSASDLVDNTQRGVFAEFIVATAIGAPVNDVRESWAPYDLTTPEGIKVEVKSAAYLQAWAQEEPSKIQFVTPRRQGWDGDTGKVDPKAKRHADVYVLALLAHQDKPTLDPMDVAQWEFYVVPTRVLEERERSQYSITLASLRKLAAPVGYAELRAAVVAAVRPNPQENP